MVAVVILNYNTYKETLDCVQSVIEKTKKNTYHIFVVDNCSTDDSYRILNEKFLTNELVTVVKTNENGGYSAGNNYICKKLDPKEYSEICIMNSDVILLNDAITIMCNCLNENDDIGVIGPSVMDRENKESQLLRKNFGFWLYFIYKKPFLFLNGITKKISTEYPFPENDNIFKFQGMVAGCCFMIKTDLLKKMNYFDDNLFLYCEEWIIGKKLEDRNKLAGYNPKAKIKHLHAVSTSKVGAGFKSFHLYLSALYYFKYYKKMNKIGLVYIYLANILAYYGKAKNDKSYKERYEDFSKMNKLIFKSNEPVKIR